jgi:hypothetical protein
MFTCPTPGCQWEGSHRSRKIHIARWCGTGLKTTAIPPPKKKKQKIGERATGAPVTNDSEGTSTSSSDSASSSGSESNDEGDAPADPGGQSDDGNRFFNVICITFFNNVLNNIVKRHQMRFLISMAGRGASPI